MSTHNILGAKNHGLYTPPNLKQKGKLMKKIENLEDIGNLIANTVNGEITLKIQDKRLVFAECTEKAKPNLDVRTLGNDYNV